MHMKFGQPLEFFIAKNPAGQFCVPAESVHRGCAIVTLKGKVWEKKTLDMTARLRGKGDIVTAGTYFGGFLPAYARWTHREGAKVWGFEPNRTNFLCASVTRALNNLDNVELLNAAVGGQAGRMAIETTDKAGRALGGGSRLVAQTAAEDEAGAQTVEMVAIDDVVGERDVSVIQLDVEGHEIEALRGAEKTIARCRPLLVLEHVVVNFREHPHFLKLARDLGYEFVAEVNQNSVFRVGGTA